MKFLDVTARFIAVNLQKLGAFCLLAMAVLTFIDIVGRMFGHPVFGAVELVGLLGVFVIACSLPVTEMENRHVSVLLVFNKLPRRVRRWLDFVTGLTSLLLFAVIGWRMFLFAGKLRATGEVSLNLHLPEYLIVYFLAACCFMVCLVIARAILGPARRKKL